MVNIEKLADQFQKDVGDGDLFGNTSYFEEAKRLKLLAGKLFYKASKETDDVKAAKLKEATRLILRASEIVKDI